MKKTIAALMLILSLSSLQEARGQSPAHLVLPNPNLLRCNPSDCTQLWSEAVEQKGAVPKQMIIDIDQGCIYGMTALYDKSVPFGQIKSAIDDRYQQWSVKEINSPVLHLWRVEPQKFSIQLSVADKHDETRHVAEAGTKLAIYIAFGGKSACSASPE
jgi:hypothetical protein